MSASERGGTRKDRKIELLGRALDFCGGKHSLAGCKTLKTLN